MLKEGEKLMFRVNDYVVYGLTGVCQITDISKDEYIETETEYYVLNPVYNNNMTIRVPVNNERVLMRSVMSKDDVISLIASMPAIEPVWIEDEKQRSAAYKAALRSGNPEEWIKIIKTLYSERKTRSDNGRKLTKTDEDILNEAEKHLHQEFSIALNIPPEKVVSYITKHIKK